MSFCWLVALSVGQTLFPKINMFLLKHFFLFCLHRYKSENVLYRNLEGPEIVPDPGHALHGHHPPPRPCNNYQVLCWTVFKWWRCLCEYNLKLWSKERKDERTDRNLLYLGMTYVQRFGSISFWRGSGSGSWDPHLGKVGPDPRIHLSVIVDPEPDPRIHIWKKWIRIQEPIFHIGQITTLTFVTAKI